MSEDTPQFKWSDLFGIQQAFVETGDISNAITELLLLMRNQTQANRTFLYELDGTDPTLYVLDEDQVVCRQASGTDAGEGSGREDVDDRIGEILRSDVIDGDATSRGVRKIPDGYLHLLVSGNDVLGGLALQWKDGNSRPGSPDAVEQAVHPLLPFASNLLLHSRERREKEDLQARLDQSDEVCRLTLESIWDAVLVTDNDGRFTFICPNTHHIFGYSNTELEAMPGIQSLLGEEFFHGKAPEALEEVQNREWQVRDKAGAVHYLMVNVRHVSIKGGTRLFTCRDVTNLREAEGQQRQSDRLFRAAIDHYPFAFAIYDAERRFEYVNQMAQDWTGVSEADLFGKRDEDLFEPAITADYLPQLKKAFDSRTPQSCLSHIIINNRQLELFINFVPLLDQKGAVHHVLGITHDITEIKVAERALQESVQLFQLVFEEAPIGMGLVTLEGRMIRFNNAFCQVLRRTPKELEDISYKDVTHPEDMPESARIYQRLLRGEAPSLEIEKRYLDPAGEIIEVILRVALLQDAEGTPLHFIVQIVDVTQRRQAERALRESERRLDLALQGADIVFWDWNLQDDYIHFGPRWRELFDYPDSEDESVLQNWYEILHPEDREDVVLALEEHFAGRTPAFESEYRFQTGTGDYRWLLARGRLLERGKSGDPVRAAGTYIDITERKQAEEALRQSESRFRRAFVDAPFPVMIYAEDGEVQRLNRRWTELTGYALHHIPTLDQWMDQAFANRQECHRVNIDEIFRHGGFVDEGEFTIQGRDDRRLTWHFASAPLGHLPDGRRLVMTMGADVTARREAEAERRELEKQVQHAQKLESLGVMAGGIAHDFNNLLLGILGNADLALMKLPPTSPGQPHLEDIVTTSQRAADLCAQMLAYSGKSQFSPQPLNLNEIVQEMEHLLEVSISRKAKFSHKFSRDLPPVLADPTQIRQVIMNLITNASDALGEDAGTISIVTGTRHCTAEELGETLLDVKHQSGLHAYLEVSDTGCGMDDETRERIFDPFFTTKFTGRGLGLATVRGIVRAHGGGIHVWSEAGVGTTFRVYLRITHDLDPREAAERVSLGDDHEIRGTILFVDDESSLRNLGKMVLEHAGLKVVLASNGHEAMEFYRQHAGDIVAVVMDLTMPEMGGQEAWEKIHESGADIPVVFSSGYAESVDLNDIPGKVGYLKKPYRPKALLEKLQEMTRAESGEEDLL